MKSRLQERVERTRNRAADDLAYLPRWRWIRRRQSRRMIELCDRLLAQMKENK